MIRKCIYPAYKLIFYIRFIHLGKRAQGSNLSKRALQQMLNKFG